MPQEVAPPLLSFPPPGRSEGCTVHLSEVRVGWSVTVTRAGRSAAFVVEHADGGRALALAQQIAAVEEADLVVLLLAGQGAGVEFVPAARVADYVLPIRPQRG